MLDIKSRTPTPTGSSFLTASFWMFKTSQTARDASLQSKFIKKGSSGIKIAFQYLFLILLGRRKLSEN